MDSLKEIRKIVKHTFASAMGDVKHPILPTESHERENSVTSIVKPVSNARNHPGSRTTRSSMRQPSVNMSDATGHFQEPERRSRKTDQASQGTTHYTSRNLDDINHDLDVKLAKRKQELQAHKSEHEKLKQDLSKMHAENDHLKQERDSLVNNMTLFQFYCDRYDYIVNQFLLPYAHEKSLQFDDRTRETLDFVLSPLVQDAKQAGMLRDQIRMLQQELLLRERKCSAISDEHFAKDFRKLAAQIKTLSRLLRPHEGLDVCETLGSCILANGVARDRWCSRAGRKLFIEAWTWSILLQMVFQNPFTIFGTESNIVFNLWSSMFDTQHFHGWPRPSLGCEIWRLTTMEQLVAVVGENTITQGSVKDSSLYLEQQVTNAREDTIATIETRLVLVAPSVDISQVRQIVDTAFTLVMRMSLQRSRFQITFPNIGDKFSTTEMRFLPILEEEEVSEHGIVASIVNPGLTKWGDVQGRALDHRYDIVPALVQLEAPFLENETGISLR